MKEKLDSIMKNALSQIEDSKELDKLNDIRVAFLGKKGELTSVLKSMKDVAPEDRPKVGQMVNEARAKIESSLEEKKAAFEQVHVGDVMDGTVETLKDYGAFVRLSNGLSGLVHVSQISDKRVVSPDKVLKEGQEVKVKVTAIKDGKLSLSMKALLESAQEEEANEHYEIPKSENIATSLGSLLKNIKL